MATRCLAVFGIIAKKCSFCLFSDVVFMGGMWMKTLINGYTNILNWSTNISLLLPSKEEQKYEPCFSFDVIHSFFILVYIIKSSLELFFGWFPGVDFKIKVLTVGGKRLKLTIWDTGNPTYMVHYRGYFFSDSSNISSPYMYLTFSQFFLLLDLTLLLKASFPFEIKKQQWCSLEVFSQDFYVVIYILCYLTTSLISVREWILSNLNLMGY